jgi:predicted nucleic acid-binding protein
MRVTPDTGILVRMNAKAAGPARKLLEEILAGPHKLVLSEFLLMETERVLNYPRMQKLYGLSAGDIDEHVRLLRLRSDSVHPVMYEPVVLADPADDPVVYAAISGAADVLCTLDRHFYAPEVTSFCGKHGVEIMSDVDLLQRLR